MLIPGKLSRPPCPTRGLSPHPLLLSHQPEHCHPLLPEAGPWPQPAHSLQSLPRRTRHHSATWACAREAPGCLTSSWCCAHVTRPGICSCPETSPSSHSGAAAEQHRCWGSISRSTSSPGREQKEGWGQGRRHLWVIPAENKSRMAGGIATHPCPAGPCTQLCARSDKDHPGTRPPLGLLFLTLTRRCVFIDFRER